MKWYGSVDNRIMETLKDPEIVVGMGATEIGWSDRHPYEVTAVRDQKHVTIRKLDAKHVGEPYTNDWELTSNPENAEIELTKRGEYWYETATLTADEYNALDEWGKIQAVLNGFVAETIATKGKQTKYRKINVKFGRAEKYYDYEF